MQALSSAPTMINSGSVTVSGIGIIPNNVSMNAMGPVTMSTGPNQSHQLSQPTNIQLIIATKSLPQAMPVSAQMGGQVLKQDVISIPVSATQMGVKSDMITLPCVMSSTSCMPQVTSGTTCMLVAQSAINTINSNQFITTSALNTNQLIANHTNTVTVTGQTPGLDLLACLECGKHFVSVAKLKSHEKTHSKSRPFKCIDCNKSFTVRYSLICHTRTHTRERPYQCTQCGSRFTQASSLKTHQIYKHTKNFPYACKQCDRGFISPGQRHEHVVRTHLKLSSSSSSRSKSKSSKAKSANNNSQQNANSTTVANNTNSNIIAISNVPSTNNSTQITMNPLEGHQVTLVNATILQPAEVGTQVHSGEIDADQLPPGSTITLAIQAIAPDSDDSLGPSMSSAACQTALSLPPLL